VLSEAHRVPSATRSGGLLVTLVYGAAIAATVVEMARRRAGRRSPLEMLFAAAAMLVVGLALPAPAAAQPLALGAGGVLLGVAFARFQLAFRDHATHAALHRGRPALLAAYNNLANTSALVGYAVMAALVAARHLASLSYARAVGLGVAALGAAAIPLVLSGARAARADEALSPERSPSP
jgi:ABC-type Co2+ transport system permease subunit